MNYEAPHCSICLQDLSHSLSTLHCGHIFHYECIIQCFINGPKSCPLCRIKFTQKQVTNLQFSLTEKPKTQINLCPDDPEISKIEYLASRLENLTQENQIASKKIQTLEEQKKRQEAQITELNTNLTNKQERLKELEDSFYKTKSMLREEEYKAEKFKEMFTNDHLKLRETQDKLTKLERIQKLIDEIEKTSSSVIWAENARESLPLEDQASQFYSALLISTNHLKAAEAKFVELKGIHSNCNEEIQKLKKMNSAIRKENQRLVGEMKVNDGTNAALKRNCEQAGAGFEPIRKEIKIEGQMTLGQLGLVNENLTVPKKTLSLLNRRK